MAVRKAMGRSGKACGGNPKEIKDMFAVLNWEQLCVLVFPRRLTRSLPRFSGPGHPVASSHSLLQRSILSDGSALSAKLFQALFLTAAYY
ncbi:UDP-GalNAc:beta-1,3-N-acetylgalactosaminyltransferase 1 isoform X7 [Saccopteryx leptura]|uniref:UDP-GalNAc:beta-1, 3-N-acetylgalactosaminyltransferase 1 isoform X7 n=1 Tax=Saccopteryx leptura TaxID=249018 RepID=UPI00339BAD25